MVGMKEMHNFISMPRDVLESIHLLIQQAVTSDFFESARRIIKRNGSEITVDEFVPIRIFPFCDSE